MCVLWVAEIKYVCKVCSSANQQRVSHQTVHISFPANDRCLRDCDLVVAHCCQQFDYYTIAFNFVTY